MPLHTFFVLAAIVAFGDTKSPCKLAPPKPTTTETTTIGTTTPPKPVACMAAWDKMQPDDDDYLESISSSKFVMTNEACSKVCMDSGTCAYSYFGKAACVTFDKFTPMSFNKNGANGGVFFKLYLNGTTTCSTVDLPTMAKTKEKMYYPDGGSYWLANMMDLVNYASYNPALGYKRKKRSILDWIFPFS